MRTILCLMAVVFLVIGGAVDGTGQENPSAASVGVGKESSGGMASAAGSGVRTISVSGTAVTNTKPDTIVWRITISDYDKEPSRAKESSDEKLKSVLSLRETLGIKPGDLETGHLRIEREYDRDERGRRTDFKHYAVIRSVTIRQREMERFDEYFSKLVSSAEMEVNVGFESSAVYDIREQTRLKALRIARHKAEAMANELGAKLGKVLTIDEHRPSGSPFNPMSNAAFFDPGSRPEVDASGGTFAPGAIEVKVTVYATFAIE